MWNIVFLKKKLNFWNNQFDQYTPLTDDSKIDFAYLALDYVELAFMWKE